MEVHVNKNITTNLADIHIPYSHTLTHIYIEMLTEYEFV